VVHRWSNGCARSWIALLCHPGTTSHGAAGVGCRPGRRRYIEVGLAGSAPREASRPPAKPTVGRRAAGRGTGSVPAGAVNGAGTRSAGAATNRGGPGGSAPRKKWRATAKRANGPRAASAALWA
jgi:hypothetical protein